MTFNERIYGVLVGGAIGDALGMPTEFWTQNQIRESFPHGVDRFYPTQEKDFLGRTMEAGSITDDTINTVMVLRSIVENSGTFKVDHYLEALIKWRNEDPNCVNVMGPSTVRALDNLAKGMPIEVSGRFGTTNGSAMKVSPIGMISDYRHPQDLIDCVAALCLATHNTTIAIAGASAIAACVSYVVRGGKDIDEMIQIALSIVDQSAGKGYLIPGPSLRRRIEFALDIVEKNSLDDAVKELYQVLGTGVETIETVPAVLAIIKMTQGDLSIASNVCASIGGDTDTIGAICCGICGGLNLRVDKAMIDQLERVNKIDFQDLTNQIALFVR